MSDIGIPISGDIVERLMRRAHTLNGRPVADGDGNTYIPGEYTRKDAALDPRGLCLHDRGWLVINSRSVIVAEGYWPRRRWRQGMR